MGSGTVGPRRTGAGRRAGRALAVTAALVAVAAGLNLAFGDSRAGAQEPGLGAQLAEDDALVDRGAQLFGVHCAICHGEAGRGVFRDGPQAGPTLIGVGAASVDFMLRTGRMPIDDAQDRLERGPQRVSDADRFALIAYVESLAPGAGPDIPDVEEWEEADLSRGLSLYTANCAACHGPTGQGIAVGQRDISATLDVASPLEIAEAIRTGPGVMPRFLGDVFTEEDVKATVAWTVHLRDRQGPGGLAFGRSGPVGEGFLAFFVGMGLLTIVMYLLGERTEYPEPERTTRRGEAADGRE